MNEYNIANNEPNKIYPQYKAPTTFHVQAPEILIHLMFDWIKNVTSVLSIYVYIIFHVIRRALLVFCLPAASDADTYLNAVVKQRRPRNRSYLLFALVEKLTYYTSAKNSMVNHRKRILIDLHLSWGEMNWNAILNSYVCVYWRCG